MLALAALAFAAPADLVPSDVRGLLSEEEWASFAPLIEDLGEVTPGTCVGMSFQSVISTVDLEVWLRRFDPSGRIEEELRIKLDERGKWRDDSRWVRSGRSVVHTIHQDGILAVHEQIREDAAGRPLSLVQDRDMAWGKSHRTQRWTYGSGGLPVRIVDLYWEGPFRKRTVVRTQRDPRGLPLQVDETLQEGPNRLPACQTVFVAEGLVRRGTRLCGGEEDGVWTLTSDDQGREIERLVVYGGEVRHLARWTRDPQGRVLALHREAPFVGEVELRWIRDPDGKLAAVEEVGSDYRLVSAASAPGCLEEPLPERGDVR